MIATTSASLTACSMDSAALPPASTTAAVRSGDVSKPMTVYPALMRWVAIGLPMIPSPMKAIVLIRSSFLLCGCKVATRSARGSHSKVSGLVALYSRPTYPR